jgi:hypothetical protein
MMKTAVLILGLSGFFGLICQPCLADTALDQACAAYGRHDYAASLKQLEALPAKLQGARAGYYRALNLQALHRYGEAADQYRKVAAQKGDLRLAALSRQGLAGISRMSTLSQNQSGQGASKDAKVATAPEAKKDEAGNVVDDKWKVQKSSFGASGANRDRDGIPSSWSWVKTSSGCGRHH